MRFAGGEDHAAVLRCLAALGTNYLSDGQYQKALSILEEAYERSLRKLGPDHATTFDCANNLGGAYMETRHLDKALGTFERLAESSRKVLGPDHPSTILYL